MANLEVGQRFRSFQEFVEAINAYGVATNAVFTTADSRRNGPNQYLKLACKHYGRPRSKSSGIRPLQKTFKQNCPVFLYAKRKQGTTEGLGGCIVIANLNLNHENHDCIAEIVSQYPERRRLDDNEKKIVCTLMSYKVQAAVLQREVRKLTGKSVNLQDLANIRYELKEESSSDLNKLEEAIGVLVEVLQKDEDAVIIVGSKDPSNPHDQLQLINLRSIIDSDDSAKEQTVAEKLLMFIFIQLGSMRRVFEEYPEILLMDNTYNITECGMPLNLCMVMDKYGCGRVISYTFLGNEVCSTIAAVLKCHKFVSPDAVDKITKAIIDKDFSERAAIEEVLGREIIVEICLFHTQKAIKEHTKDIVDKDVREATRKVLQKNVYSESEEEYSDLVKKLEEVPPHEKYQYFLTNWDSIREAWVLYEKLFVPNFGNNTTNRVKNKNRHLKHFLIANAHWQTRFGESYLVMRTRSTVFLTGTMRP